MANFDQLPSCGVTSCITPRWIFIIGCRRRQYSTDFSLSSHAPRINLCGIESNVSLWNGLEVTQCVCRWGWQKEQLENERWITELSFQQWTDESETLTLRFAKQKRDKQGSEHRIIVLVMSLKARVCAHGGASILRSCTHSSAMYAWTLPPLLGFCVTN